MGFPGILPAANLGGLSPSSPALPGDLRGWCRDLCPQGAPFYIRRVREVPYTYSFAVLDVRAAQIGTYICE